MLIFNTYVIKVTLLLLLTPILGHNVKLLKYTNTKGIRLPNSGVFLVTTPHLVTSKSSCCSACAQHASCLSVNFKESSGTCELVPLPYLALSAFGITDTEWETYSTNEWLLVFRGTPGIGGDIYEAWVNGVGITTNTADCMSTDVTSCSQHYRNPIVDSWATLNIKVVKYALYKGGSEGAAVTFDGTGTSITDWFDKHRVLVSSWSDIQSHSFNYFSIAGHDSSRRFLINIDYPGCPFDRSFTVAIGANVHRCNYDNQPSYPQFLFSNTSSYGYPDTMTDYDKADVMVIYIKA